MRKLLMLAGITAQACFGVNFAFVQEAHHLVGVAGTIATAFGSSNTAGNAIFVLLYTVSGSTSFGVTDSVGNTYHVMTVGSPIYQYIYAADHIAAGSNTVTVTGGASSVVVMEYSSVSSTYFICPGESINFSGNVVNGGAFRTTTEAMAVIEAYSVGGFHAWTLTPGTSRDQLVEPGGQGVYAGENDVSSVSPAAYSSIIGGGSFSSNAVAFMSLTSGTGCNGSGASPTNSFPIIY